MDQSEKQIKVIYVYYDMFLREHIFSQVRLKLFSQHHKLQIDKILGVTLITHGLRLSWESASCPIFY